jgi:hypothetical protein
MMRRFSAIAFAIAIIAPAAAQAQEFPRSFNEPPRGPGTEQASKYRTAMERVRPGWEAGVQAGGGIGFGIGARAGYSFVPGFYAGGSVSHFFGQSVSTLVGKDDEPQTLVGVDFGYKIFPQAAIELRPFLFAGFGVFNRLNQGNQIVDQYTDLALVPSFLAAYHIGNLFVSAESRLEVIPSPVHFALLGGVGLGI